MPRPTRLVAPALLTVGAVALVRHHREQRAVQRGDLAPAWPATRVVPRGRAGPVARRVAVWDPPRPGPGWPRRLARLWAAPLSALGLVFALASRADLHWDGEAGVVIATNARGPARFIGLDANALGHVIIARGQPSGRLLAHEMVHVRQAERLGPILFPLYVWWLARHGYRDHPIERGARTSVRRRLVHGGAGDQSTDRR